MGLERAQHKLAELGCQRPGPLTGTQRRALAQIAGSFPRLSAADATTPYHLIARSCCVS